MILDQALQLFLDYIVRYRGRSINTQHAYAFDISKFISYLNLRKVILPEQVTTNLIEDYLSHLDCSIVTKARIRSAIKSFFSFLLRKSYIITDPTSSLETIKIPEKSPEYLSKEQQTILIRTIEKTATPYYKQRDLMIVKLLLKTGLRRAEIVGLNIEDIDFYKSTLKVKRKGNKQVFVSMHPQLVIDIKMYLEEVTRASNEPLFLSKKGKRLSASSIWHLVKSYACKAGLNKVITVHSLRHTFASTLLAQGFAIPFIQTLMGHKSPETTSRYLHFQNNELINAFNKINFE